MCKETKLGRKEKKDIFKWNLVFERCGRRALEGVWMGVSCCVLKSQVNEHDKLLLLALTLPQVAMVLSGLLLKSLVDPPTSSNSPPFPFPLSWEALVAAPVTVGRGGGSHSIWGSWSQWVEQRGSECKVSQVVPSIQIQLSATAV